MQKIIIFGATGMLGHACKDILNKSKKYDVVSTSRIKQQHYVKFDASYEDPKILINEIKPDWIINCIGIIKPYIDETSPQSISRAVAINSVFPEKLSLATPNPIIQIATDCVYSGNKGAYLETDVHDATDVYGKTKSLGEIPSENLMHIRASIIGPELGRSTSLLEWFKNQPINSNINGYVDHLWNGITTHAFGRLCEGIINQGNFKGGKYHVIPKDIVTKADLLRIFSKVYNRSDVTVHDTNSSNRIDRTLSTNDLEFSNNVWESAGYGHVPSIEEMVLEQANLTSSIPKT